MYLTGTGAANFTDASLDGIIASGYFLCLFVHLSVTLVSHT